MTPRKRSSNGGTQRSQSGSSKRGFAGMSRQKRLAAARKGGLHSHGGTSSS